jgi:hypothetical protein
MDEEAADGSGRDPSFLQGEPDPGNGAQPAAAKNGMRRAISVRGCPAGV